VLRRHKIVLAVVVGLPPASVMLVQWLFPVSWLAARQWEVVVVDEQGKPVEGMTVREAWKNYSVETEGHQEDRQTDKNGRANFARQYSPYSVVRQIAGTARSLAHFQHT
jgi:hypothetical protein